MNAIPQVFLGRRAALTGLSVAVVIFVIVVVVPVVAAVISQHQEIADSLHQLALYRAELAHRPELETELQALRQRGAAAPGLIVADNASLAEAQLERDIKSLVEANAGEIHSAQIGETRSMGDLDLIAVQYELSVPITHLSALVYAIESHTPYFFIDHADISAPLDWQPATHTGSSPPPEPKLEVRWTIRSYRWSAK